MSEDAVAEVLECRTPEGRAAARARYQAQLRARAAQLESRSPEEVWRQAGKAGVPLEAVKALQRQPEASTALERAKEFAADREALFLLLMGPAGVGKTLAAVHVVVDFCGKWAWNEQPGGKPTHPVEYVDSASVTRLSAFNAADQDFVERLRNARLLVLEDVGDEGTELGKGLLVELLMARHASRRRTVLTTNLTAEAFKQRYGAAVADRIRNTGLVPNLHGEKSRRVKRGKP